MKKFLLLALLAVVFGVCPSASSQRIDEPYTISTAAGVAGAFGSVDGTGSAARFTYPYGIARDAMGNIFVADTYNFTIRKITPAGVVTTIAGLAGVSGAADGTGTSARFNYPYDIAVDNAGNLYVADTNNHTIRKITSAGAVTTLAGLAGVQGSADGTGSAARFDTPNSLTVDGVGNIYVADTFNDTIRKITPGGTVTTFAGTAGVYGYADGTGSAALFAYAFGIKTDAAGNLYVADTYNQCIRKITPGAVVTTFAGTAGQTGTTDGGLGEAKFNHPRGLAVDDAGNIYVADESNDLIRKITPEGITSTLAGVAEAEGSTDGVGSGARFKRPAAIAVNGAGAITIADTQNFTIRRGSLTAQQGAVDQIFDAGTFTNGQVMTSVLQPDGKIIIGGTFNKVHGIARHNIARLNADGTLDPSFDPAGGPDYSLSVIRLQNDGKLLISGSFSQVNGVARLAFIARLNSDGSLDVAFDPGRRISFDGMDDGQGNATNSGSVNDILLQPDGKIIVAGAFYYIITGPSTRVPRSGVARFNADGTFDPTFDPGDGVPNINFAYVQSGAVDSNGKIILQGFFDSFDGHPAAGLVRLSADGSYDPTFDAGTGADAGVGAVLGLLPEADGKLLVFGAFSSFNGAARAGLVRLLSGGGVDAAFAPPSFANYDTGPAIYAVVPDANGKLLVGGFFHSAGGAVANNIARLETDGNRDATFDSAGAGPSAYQINTILVQPNDGRVFVGGYFSTFGGEPRNNLARMNADGTVDSTFAGLSGATDGNPQIYALAVQPDGKILVGGAFSSFNGVSHYNLVRLNPDATIDPSFDPNFQTEGSVRAMLLQPDGKILIAGNIRAVNGIARGHLARLNPDGTLDLAFNSGTGAENVIYALSLDPDGSIYAGGAFLAFNAGSQSRIVKLTQSGNLDPTFDAGAGPTSTVYALAGHADGGIVLGGSFSSVNGVAAGRIAHLDASGGVDTSFNSGGSGFNSSVRALRLGADGKYYAGGFFSTFNGMQRHLVARLLSDGSLDSSFANPGLTKPVYSLAFQSGKLLAGGLSFGAPDSALVQRLNPDGTLDGTFDVGTGFEFAPANSYTAGGPSVTALAVQANGKPLAGGIFNHFYGTPRICLARLGDSPLAFTAVSRKSHGTAGVFDINLPLTGAPGIECRTGPVSGQHEIDISFGGPVNFSGAAVSGGTGQVMQTSGSGTDMATITLSGVSNAQRLTLTLNNATYEGVPQTVSVPIGFLLGDVNGSGGVSASDVGQTKSQSGQPLTQANFRSDVNASGAISASDIGLLKSQSGMQLPPTAPAGKKLTAK